MYLSTMKSLSLQGMYVNSVAAFDKGSHLLDQH